MKKKIASISASATALLLPALAFAQTGPTQCLTGANYGAETILCKIYRLIQIAIPILILGGVAYFVYGLIGFMSAAGEEEKAASRAIMVNGVISLAVIVGLWGLVRLLLGTFGVDTGGPSVGFPTF